MHGVTSTYRLQLHAGFTMDHAAAEVGYLRRLGVTHLYLSPVLEATPGSMHGYDAVDPTRLDGSRGGREGFERLLSATRAVGLGLVLDVVPNHVDVSGKENRWWRSVLRLGRRSGCAEVFDIEWSSPAAEDRVVLPVLGEPLADAIADGRLTLTREKGSLDAAYFEHRWPLRPRTVAEVLVTSGAAGVSELAERFETIETDGDERHCPDGRVERLIEELGETLAAEPAAAAAVDRRLAALSEPAALAAVLERQAYRLASWRDGARTLNYRRFFDVDTLAAVRADDPAVFDRTHGLIVELAGMGGVDGLRIDHPDGLRDPTGYFERLAARAPGTWIVAEKVLERDEAMPADWPVAGTTGYDFLNDALGVLIDPAGRSAIDALYESLTGRAAPFLELARSTKAWAACEMLGADLDRLTRLAEAAMNDGVGLPPRLGEMLTAIAAGMAVYRTYLRPDEVALRPEDAARLSAAVAYAAESDAGFDAAVLRRLAALLGEPGDDAAARELAMRFQQFTAPVAAKGVEDTAFYRDVRFVALNEVGGDPGHFGLSAGDFHERVLERSARWPASMNTTSTHDTKRSGDVRARLAVLSEMPEVWRARVEDWMVAARRLGPSAVDPADAYLLFQTLVGAWPLSPERLEAFMIKAVREGKQRTSWTDPDRSYEAALSALVHALLADDEFTASVSGLVEAILAEGRIKSLTQTALRLACPGVADTYQGCELWDLSLVDPDNRRPVDYTLRASLLDRLDRAEPREVWATLDDPGDPGIAKLWLTRTLLGLRRLRPAVFTGRGLYEPVRVDGVGAEAVLAFGRGPASGPVTFVAVLPLRSPERAADATIDLPASPTGVWTNAASGRSVEPGERRAGEVFADAPLAVLVSEEERP